MATPCLVFEVAIYPQVSGPMRSEGSQYKILRASSLEGSLRPSFFLCLPPLFTVQATAVPAYQLHLHAAFQFLLSLSLSCCCGLAEEQAVSLHELGGRAA